MKRVIRLALVLLVAGVPLMGLAPTAAAATSLDRTLWSTGDPVDCTATYPNYYHMHELHQGSSSVCLSNRDPTVDFEVLQIGQTTSVGSTTISYVSGVLDAPLDGVSGGSAADGRLGVVHLRLGDDPASLELPAGVAVLRVVSQAFADLLDANETSSDWEWHASRPVRAHLVGRDVWLAYRFSPDDPQINGRTVVLRLFPPAEVEVGALPPAPAPTASPTPVPSPVPLATAPPAVHLSEGDACLLLTGAKTPDASIDAALEGGYLVVDTVDKDQRLVLDIYKAFESSDDLHLSKLTSIAGPIVDLATGLGIAPCVAVGQTSANSLASNALGFASSALEAVDQLARVFSRLPWFLGLLPFAAGLLQLFVGLRQILKIVTRPDHNFLDNLGELATSFDGVNALLTTASGIAGIVGGVTLVLGIGALIAAIAVVGGVLVAGLQLVKDVVKATRSAA